MPYLNIIYLELQIWVVLPHVYIIITHNYATIIAIAHLSNNNSIIFFQGYVSI